MQAARTTTVLHRSNFTSPPASARIGYAIGFMTMSPDVFMWAVSLALALPVTPVERHKFLAIG